MTFDVDWSATARREFAEAMDYIALDRPNAARTLAAQIGERIEQLRNHPMRGRAGSRAGTRELVLPGTPFVVIYSTRKNGPLILRFLHGRRDRSGV